MPLESHFRLLGGYEVRAGGVGLGDTAIKGLLGNELSSEAS